MLFALIQLVVVVIIKTLLLHLNKLDFSALVFKQNTASFSHVAGLAYSAQWAHTHTSRMESWVGVVVRRIVLAA